MAQHSSPPLQISTPPTTVNQYTYGTPFKSPQTRVLSKPRRPRHLNTIPPTLQNPSRRISFDLTLHRLVKCIAASDAVGVQIVIPARKESGKTAVTKHRNGPYHVESAGVTMPPFRHTQADHRAGSASRACSATVLRARTVNTALSQQHCTWQARESKKGWDGSGAVESGGMRRVQRREHMGSGADGCSVWYVSEIQACSSVRAWRT